MDRIDLRNAYSVIPLQERRNLADHMGYSMPRLYQYIMRPSSNSISKNRLEKLLNFYPLSKWYQLSNLGSQKSSTPIVLKLNLPCLQQPDIIEVNGQKYQKI